MIYRLFKKLFSWFDTRTEYEKLNDERIIESIRNAPKSLKVTRRGGITVDPEEIIKSPAFQRDLKRAAKIVRSTRQ